MTNQRPKTKDQNQARLGQKQVKNSKTIFFSFDLSFTLYTLIFILFLLSNAAKANAQEIQHTFTIVPPTVEVSLNPGQKTEGILKVINDSTNPLTFTASVDDFIVDNPNGIPNLLSNNTFPKRFSAASWIGIVPSVFTIPAQSKQILNYYLQVPQDARPGGHYAAAVYTPTSKISIKGTGASVETKIGTLFLISINGNINESSVVKSFSSNPFQEYGPVKLTVEIANNGDLHITPQGEIIVTDIFGRIVDQQRLASLDIFPTASRIYTNSVGGKIMIGPFKARLLASYGRNKNLPLSSTVYFWVFPWKIAILALLIIIAIVLGIMYWRKRVNTQQTTNGEASSSSAY